ncbi:MAG: GDP-mannose 4,6-dehydratase [Bacteroidota bacterium]
MKTQEETFKDAEILITGGLGFIGSNLAHRLVTLGAHVTIIDAMIPDYGGNLFNIEDIKKKVTVNISDVRDVRSLEYLVRGKQFLFNLAGQISHIDSMLDPYTDMEINVRSQLCILESCRKHNKDVKIVFAGTRQVYGKPDYLPVDEHHPLRPTDVNGINKLAGEWYHLLYHTVYGIRACALRLTNTYGPRQLIKHSRQGFISWFIRQIVEGTEIKIFGDGKQIRDFNFIDDVVDALLTAAVDETADGKIYNLGGSEPVALKALVELMIDVAGQGSYSLVPFPEEKKKIDIGSFYGDYSKITRELGWKPKVSLRDGLAISIDYYKKNLEKYL